MTGFYSPCHMYPHVNTEDTQTEQLLSRSSHHVKPVPCPPRATNIGNRSNCSTANKNLHREESHVDDVNSQKSRMNEDPFIHRIDLNLNSQIPWTTSVALNLRSSLRTKETHLNRESLILSLTRWHFHRNLHESERILPRRP